MSKRNKISSYKSALATDLRHLSNILMSKNVCCDTGPLTQAANDLKSSNGDSWFYDISELRILAPVPKGIHPKGAKEFLLDLNIKAKGTLSSAEDDKFEDLSIQVKKTIVIAGCEKKSSWHFDRHIKDLYKEELNNEREIHPLYHLQFGGNVLKELNSLGDTFTLAPPRIMHPPLDIFLCIDFVLANYNFAKWKELREDSEYNRIIMKRYEEIWVPYFNSFNFINNKIDRSEASKFICPFI